MYFYLPAELVGGTWCSAVFHLPPEPDDGPLSLVLLVAREAGFAVAVHVPVDVPVDERPPAVLLVRVRRGLTVFALPIRARLCRVVNKAFP